MKKMLLLTAFLLFLANVCFGGGKTLKVIVRPKECSICDKNYCSDPHHINPEHRRNNCKKYIKFSPEEDPSKSEGGAKGYADTLETQPQEFRDIKYKDKHCYLFIRRHDNPGERQFWCGKIPKGGPLTIWLELSDAKIPKASLAGTPVHFYKYPKIVKKISEVLEEE